MAPTEVDPLVVARAMLNTEPENKAEEAMRIAMMPWLTFAMAGWLFLYCYEFLPSLVVSLLATWAVMCACTLLAIQRKPKAPVAQGKHGLVVALSLVSLVLGALMGFWNYKRVGGVSDYWETGAHRQYKDVAPEELADAHRDASVLVFEKGSRPDARMATAYVSGSLGQKYCVAPVIATRAEYTGSFTVQYFAAGKDCCENLDFSCGEAKNQGARAGLVMFNKTQDSIFDWIFGTPDLEYYRKAAAMASAKYGVKLAEDPIFVTWAMNSDSVAHSLWPQARNFWLLSSFMALPLCAMASALGEVLASFSVAKGYVPFFEKADDDV